MLLQSRCVVLQLSYSFERGLEFLQRPSHEIEPAAIDHFPANSFLLFTESRHSDFTFYSHRSESAALVRPCKEKVGSAKPIAGLAIHSASAEPSVVLAQPVGDLLLKNLLGFHFARCRKHNRLGWAV